MTCTRIKQMIKYLLLEDYRCNYYINKYYSVGSDRLYRLLVKKLIKRKMNKRKFIVLGINSKAGENIFLPHPRNVVIGDRVIIGNNCRIYQGVTIGQSKGMYPKIGDNVIIYPGAKIIGDVSIGDNSIVGTNAVVTKNVPSNTIVAGIPARVLKSRAAQDKFY